VHYYKRNLGDYAKKAGRLSMLQHGAYTLLIDACYDREQFPTRDEAIDWTWASSTAEIEAVDFVLAKFFVLVDGMYVQNRIQQELTAYHATSETNKRIALEREAKRNAASTERARSVDESSPNHEPVTINHKPQTKEPRPDAPRKRDDLFEQLWKAYPKKVGKDAAKKAFDKRKPDGDLFSAMLQAIEKQSRSDDWTKGGGQFIPHPATWLNAGRWMDETETSPPVSVLFPGAI